MKGILADLTSVFSACEKQEGGKTTLTITKRASGQNLWEGAGEEAYSACKAFKATVPS